MPADREHAGLVERFHADLPGGESLLFRPIEPADKERLLRGFDELSPEARYKRFLRPVTRLSASQLIYLTEVDGRDHFAWVAPSMTKGNRVSVSAGGSGFLTNPASPRSRSR